MEMISLLTMAKDAGFETGSIISLIAIYLMLKKFVAKQNDELKSVLDTQVNKIVEAIGKHNVRLDGLESDVQFLKKNAIMREQGEQK